MTSKVTVVDYGVGNLLSVVRALEHCGAEVQVESAPEHIAQAERLVLPGVGAFGEAMSELRSRNLVEPVRQYGAGGRPLLGICLGMQMLLEGSDEFGSNAGLGLIPGWVRKLPPQAGTKLPHIGWSALHPAQANGWGGSVLEKIADDEEVYFVHTFHAEPLDPAHRLALTAYGDFRFCSVVQKQNIVGCQFHPEKSGETGLNIIRQFLTM